MTYILYMIKVLFMIMTLFVSKFIPYIAQLILFMLTFVIKVLSMIMKNMMILLANIYGIHDQEVIIPPILPSINTHEQDIPLSPTNPPPTPIHETPTSTCHDETYAFQVSIEDQTNEHKDNQDPNDPSTSTIESISNPPPYPLGLSAFIHECSSLGQQQPLSSTSPSPSNNKLKSNSQITHSPTVDRMLQKMNYQGKGLGLLEQGILEPIHVKIPPPRSYGLGYTP